MSKPPFRPRLAVAPPPPPLPPATMAPGTDAALRRADLARRFRPHVETLLAHLRPDGRFVGRLTVSRAFRAAGTAAAPRLEVYLPGCRWFAFHFPPLHRRTFEGADLISLIGHILGVSDDEAEQFLADRLAALKDSRKGLK